MQLASLPTELEASLEQFALGGGVIRYFVFAADAEASLHHRATLEAFERLKPDLEPFQLTLEPGLMSSAVVSIETFLGDMRASKEVFNSPKAYLDASTKALSKTGVFRIQSPMVTYGLSANLLTACSSTQIKLNLFLKRSTRTCSVALRMISRFCAGRTGGRTTF